MPVFKYRGRTFQGKVKEGQIEASSQNAVVDLLQDQGVIPLQITPVKEKSQDIDLSRLFNTTLPIEVLVIFCRQLYSLTKAGVPILRSLKGLAESAKEPLLKSTLQELSADLTNGSSLSVSMKKHPRVFSDLFISMIQVGENTGRLDDALLQLSNYYEQELETRRRIKAATRYPKLVISAISIAMVILNIYVVPQFVSMFTNFGTELPLPTKILMATSNAFVNYWPHMIVGLIAVWFGFRLWLQTKDGREKWDSWRLKAPIIGPIINRAQMSRFSRTFALMLRAGVALNQAIQLSAQALGNRYLENRLINMKQGIESGQSIANTAVNTGIFTPLVLQMITVGEETGQIDDLLLEVSDFYDREVDYDLKNLTAKIEPILLAVVGVMVGMLAMGIFMPMWGMLDIVKGS